MKINTKVTKATYADSKNKFPNPKALDPELLNPLDG